jgi:NAD-dependent protein deacetylase/lipoamidase
MEAAPCRGPPRACERWGAGGSFDSFGQALDGAVIDAAVAAAGDCDVFLAVGTSLTVHPAAGLTELAAAHGARVVVVNAEPTPYDDLADLVVREPIGAALPRLLAGASPGIT